jgi:hypothetical protein
MTSISNRSAHGTATPVVAQSAPTAPLDGGRPWGTPSQHPALSGFANTAETQIVGVSLARQEFAGGVNTGCKMNVGKDI